MSHIIVIDEPALKECVESNLYQSRQFEAGERLANALRGDTTATTISARLIPGWRKGALYLLQSKIETGYLLIDSVIFESLPTDVHNDTTLDEVLLVFQRVCRFALKEWNNLSFSFSEMWSPKTGCGVVFPYPKSKHTEFRVTLKRGEAGRRISVRHGTKQLFAFAAGTGEETAASDDQERAYKRAIEELTQVRVALDGDIARIQAQPDDLGFHSLVLSNTAREEIKYQAFDLWLSRLTKDQLRFVTSPTTKPQRVEGPAGTGKTLSLLLRAFYLCREAEKAQSEFRVLFVAHSDATRNATAIQFDSLGPPFYHQRQREDALQSIELRTLQEWCGRVLGAKEIATSQYLDQDALEAKEMRKLILRDVIAKRRENDPRSLDYLSSECREFFKSEALDYLAELLQHEIGVMIKGRASESLETYLKLPLLEYCLPTRDSNDKRFVFSIFKRYQKELNQSGVFDTDDIVLSTLGRLNTPIWRRRRLSEGFDGVVIDETHLFNFNELSIFHHIVRDTHNPRIIFSIDRSQAPGERGITTKLVKEILTQSDEEAAETRTSVVFRSSPGIVRLAEAVTSAGATLFTTFENPLLDTSSVISATDDELASEPVYWTSRNDAEMCQFAVRRAEEIRKVLRCPPSDVLLVATTERLVTQVAAAVEAAGKQHVQIIHRGDLEQVRQGEKYGAYIVSHPDFVGGLEFKAVLIVGVDEGRLPPSEGIIKEESKHFVDFKACNRLYVAISRARLVVELFRSAERGTSSILEHARAVGAVVQKDAS